MAGFTFDAENFYDLARAVKAAYGGGGIVAYATVKTFQPMITGRAKISDPYFYTCYEFNTRKTETADNKDNWWYFKHATKFDTIQELAGRFCASAEDIVTLNPKLVRKLNGAGTAEKYEDHDMFLDRLKRDYEKIVDASKAEDIKTVPFGDFYGGLEEEVTSYWEDVWGDESHKRDIRIPGDKPQLYVDAQFRLMQGQDLGEKRLPVVHGYKPWERGIFLCASSLRSGFYRNKHSEKDDVGTWDQDADGDFIAKVGDRIKPQTYLGITDMYISNSTELVQPYVFHNAPLLKRVEFENRSATLNDNPKDLHAGAKKYGIHKYAFAECKRLERINLVPGISMLSEGTFLKCNSLTRIVLPEGIIKIGPRAFESCTSLYKIYLPKSLKTIDDNAFRGCVSLKAVMSSATFIGNSAFEKCETLAYFESDAESVEVKDSAFDETDTLIDAKTRWRSMFSAPKDGSSVPALLLTKPLKKAGGSLYKDLQYELESHMDNKDAIIRLVREIKLTTIPRKGGIKPKRDYESDVSMEYGIDEDTPDPLPA